VKQQYGIDTVGDGMVHHRVPAVAGTSYGDWDPATLLAAPVPTLNRIKAARIAVLVRSEQHDKELAGQGFNYPVFNDCADDAAGGCGVTFNIPAVSAATQPYGWRYRVYETVIPLRNEVWNKEV
jgi:type IV pilus assembly protein PilW